MGEVKRSPQKSTASGSEKVFEVASMFHVIMYQPEIPPNTGNIIRLCANVGAGLHLVHPLGFSMDEARLRRAGLDYRELASVTEHGELGACLASVAPQRVFALTTRAQRHYHQAAFQSGDAFLFGPETRGLPAAVLDGFPPDNRLRIPMRPGNRSLNLSNAVAVVVYEAWRQIGFPAGR
jgi:tRNA (cytidine/uridine-2'-O-)-methyltransferase